MKKKSCLPGIVIATFFFFLAFFLLKRPLSQLLFFLKRRQEIQIALETKWKNFITRGILYQHPFVYAGTAQGLGIFQVISPSRIVLKKIVKAPGIINYLEYEKEYIYASYSQAGVGIYKIIKPGKVKLAGKFKERSYINSLALYKNYLLLASTRGLLILNIRKKAKPYLISLLPLGRINSIFCYGDTAYLTVAHKGLFIVSLRHPEKALLLSQLPLPAPDKPEPADPLPHDVVVYKGYAYIGNGSQGLALVNAKNPARPRLLKYIKRRGFVSLITLWGKKAFIRVLPDRTELFSLKVPGNPLLLTTLPGPGSVSPHGISGNHFIFRKGRGLQLLTLQGEKKVLELATYRFPLSANCSIFQSGLLYVCYGDQGVVVYDTQTPSRPRPLARLPVGNFANKALPFPPYLFVSDSMLGTKIFDLRKKTNSVTALNETQHSWDMAIYKKELYIAAGNRGLTIYHFDSPDSLKLLSETPPPGNEDNFVGIAVNGHRALLLGIMATYLFDIRNKAHPQLLSILPSSHAAALFSGNLIYLASYKKGLQVALLKNQHLYLRSGYPTKGKAVALTLNHTKLYLAASKKIYLLDVKDPFAPKLLRRYRLRQEAQDLSLGKNYLYVADGAAGVTTIPLH